MAPGWHWHIPVTMSHSPDIAKELQLHAEEIDYSTERMYQRLTLGLVCVAFNPPLDKPTLFHTRNIASLNITESFLTQNIHVIVLMQ